MNRTFSLIFSILLVLTGLVACSSESIPNEQQDDAQVPLLKMKFAVNFGMDADILVDSISKDSIVTYRYFDYQHSDEPNSEQETSPIEEFFKTHKDQSGEFPEYIMKMYLDYEDFSVEINVTDDFKYELRNNEKVRQEIASQLGKPLNKEIADLMKIRKREN